MRHLCNPDVLQQCSKLLDGEARVAGNPARCKRIHRIVAGNRHYALTVAHDDVLPLTHDPEIQEWGIVGLDIFLKHRTRLLMLPYAYW